MCDKSPGSSHTSKSLLTAADRPLAGQRSCVSPSALLEPLPLQQRGGQTLLQAASCRHHPAVPGHRQLSCAI